MKKVLAFSLTIAILVTGCSASFSKASYSSDDRMIPSGTITVPEMTDFTVYIDRHTGCHYMYAGHGFTPVYDASGKVEGCGQIKQ